MHAISVCVLTADLLNNILKEVAGLQVLDTQGVCLIPVVVHGVREVLVVGGGLVARDRTVLETLCNLVLVENNLCNVSTHAHIPYVVRTHGRADGRTHTQSIY